MTVTDWPADEPLFDNADGEFPPLGQCRLLLRRGRWVPIEDGPSIDTYEGGQQADRHTDKERKNTMTREQYEATTPQAIKSLHYSGDPEQDHLIDEIQHEDTTNALYEMPARPAKAA